MYTHFRQFCRNAILPGCVCALSLQQQQPSTVTAWSIFLRVGYEVAASHAQLKKTLNGYDGYIHLDFTMCSLAWLHSIILCINLLCNTL